MLEAWVRGFGFRVWGLGYPVLYLDVDVAMLRDPFPLLRRDADAEVMSGAPDAESAYGGRGTLLRLGLPLCFHAAHPLNRGVWMLEAWVQGLGFGLRGALFGRGIAEGPLPITQEGRRRRGHERAPDAESAFGGCAPVYDAHNAAQMVVEWARPAAFRRLHKLAPPPATSHPPPGVSVPTNDGAGRRLVVAGLSPGLLFLRPTPAAAALAARIVKGLSAAGGGEGEASEGALLDHALLAPPRGDAGGGGPSGGGGPPRGGAPGGAARLRVLQPEQFCPAAALLGGRRPAGLLIDARGVAAVHAGHECKNGRLAVMKAVLDYSRGSKAALEALAPGAKGAAHA